LFINNIALSLASQRRIFFEEQLKNTNDALLKSEQEIQLFQEKTGIIKVESQTSIFIQKIAKLQAQITAREIELQVLQSYSTANSPDVQKIEETIKALNNELAKLNTSTAANNKMITSGTIPLVTLEYQRIIRQLKFREALNDIMLKQYEAAKIDESEDTILIQVIDKAIPPQTETYTRKFARKKALTLTLLTFFSSCFFVFVREFLERVLKTKENNEKINTLIKHLSIKRNV